MSPRETLNGAMDSQIIEPIIRVLGAADSTKTTDGVVDDGSISKSRRLDCEWLGAILLGQFIAILSASSNAASFTLVNRFGFQAPFFLLFLVYSLLSLHFFRRDDDLNTADESNTTPQLTEEAEENEDLARIRNHSLASAPARRRFLNSLKCPLWMYFLISILDVFPNVLVLLALQYTSLTSITLLLGSLAVPSTMFCSSRLLSRYFTFKHYVGVCLCILGAMLAVGLDSSSYSETTTTTNMNHHAKTTSSDDSFPLNIGDVLMCTAALLYGLGDTVAEYFVKQKDRSEYLGMLGVFGMLQTVILFPWLDHVALVSGWDTMTYQSQSQSQSPQPLSQYGLVSSTDVPSDRWQMFATLVWYVASCYLYYVMEVHFLATSDATLLNLSMQAANLWAILFSALALSPQLRNVPPPLFYVALVLVVSGVVLYEMDGTRVIESQQEQSQKESQCMGCWTVMRRDTVDDDDDDESDLSEIEALLAPEAVRHDGYNSCKI